VYSSQRTCRSTSLQCASDKSIVQTVPTARENVAFHQSDIEGQPDPSRWPCLLTATKPLARCGPLLARSNFGRWGPKAVALRTDAPSRPGRPRNREEAGAPCRSLIHPGLTGPGALEGPGDAHLESEIGRTSCDRPGETNLR
jgi:hypothetical protein